MNPDDVLTLLDGHVAAAAVGAAMERGLFWLLAEEPRRAADVAESLEMPPEQCRYWLEHLATLGLLDRSGGTYVTSAPAREAVVTAYSHDTWAFLARSAREELPTVCELSTRLADPHAPAPPAAATPDYVSQMRDDPDQAAEFTRMLYEIHLPLADEFAAATRLESSARVLDVGGGSGVMSLALLRRNPQLHAVVVDLATVCDVGRQIASENGLQNRIEYRPLDFIAEDLPTGFDVTLFCDVGGYTEPLLSKFHASLVPGGRLVIVDKFGAGPGLPHPSRTHWALLGSVRNGAPRRFAAADIVAMLRATGFEVESQVELPERVSRWSSGWTMITSNNVASN